MRNSVALLLLLAAVAAVAFLSPDPPYVRSQEEDGSVSWSVLKGVKDATRDTYQSIRDAATSKWQTAKEKLAEASAAASEASAHVREALFGHKSRKVPAKAQDPDSSTASYGEQAAETLKRPRAGEKLQEGAQSTYSTLGDTAGLGKTKDPETLGSSSAADLDKAKGGAYVTSLRLDNLNLKPVTAPILLNFFNERKISKATVDRNGVMQHGSGEFAAAAFVYRRNKQIVACKFRRAHKRYTLVPGYREKILYGLDDIKGPGQSEIVIVEGEMDKLAMDEAGIRHCVSVPDGAPRRVSGERDQVPPPMEDREYQYLWNCKDYFAKATKIVLATDNDAPGQALAEALARRLGRERCWRVKWPEFEGKPCKDANEVLANLGKQDLVRMVAEAEVWHHDQGASL